MTLRRKSENIVGFLDRGTEVTGELQFSNTLRIDGSFHGSIVGKERLIVGEEAVVHADIKVGEIEIRGQVFGNIEAERQVEIFATGRLRGDLRASTLTIQAGAVFEGRSEVAGPLNQKGLRENAMSQNQPGAADAVQKE